MTALDAAVLSGKALYVGISSYDSAHSREAATILRDLGTPLLNHQPSYSMINRWIESDGLLDTAAELGFGVIGFTALAQGLLTDRYLEGVPADSRVARAKEGYGVFERDWLGEETIAMLRQLNGVAERHGHSLAQLALAWALRDERVTSLVIGASSVRQLEQNVAMLESPELDAEEVAEIEEIIAGNPAINPWQEVQEGEV